MRPFEGIRVLDATHVIAGPFATYELALLGADVIKIEHPRDPDQSRITGSDLDLNERGMGLSFLTQGSNKRSLTLDLKAAPGREILKDLVKTADILVENFRPGAFDSLGLDYETLSGINPRLIYCSMSAFGSEGARRNQTAVDPVIQASSGLMAMTGTPETNPIKIGAPVLDYATGTMGAFALSAALFQRERTGRGQRIDLAMFDVALVLASLQMSRYVRTGLGPKPAGNDHRLATCSCFATKDGSFIMLGATNLRQRHRLWAALDLPEMIDDETEDTKIDRAAEVAVLARVLVTRTAQEWEEFFQSRHVPAARVRGLTEALSDPHTADRQLIHMHTECPDVPGTFGVPLSGFRFLHGGAKIDAPPQPLGAQTDEVLGELGYDSSRIAALRQAGII